MGFSDLFPCLKGSNTEPNLVTDEEEQQVVIDESQNDVMTGKKELIGFPNIPFIADDADMAALYAKRTGGGRKSVSAERYDPNEDADDDEPSKVIPKSDTQRKRLQAVAAKVMLLNRLDEVCFHFLLFSYMM